MITVLQQPNAVSFSRNPVLFELQTNNRYVSTGRVAKFRLSITVGLTAGSSFSLTWNGAAFIFQFVNTASQNNGLELTAFQGGSLTSWIDVIVSELQENFYLRADFRVYREDNIIWLESLRNDTGLNITYTPISGMGSVSAAQTQTAQDPVPRKNFAVLLELWVEREDRAAFDRYAQSSVEVDNDGRVIWDIQKYLTAIILKDGPVLPDLIGSSVVADNRSVRRYYIMFAEMYGEPQRVAKMEKSDTLTVVLGGFDTDHMHNTLPDYFMSSGLPAWCTRMKQKVHRIQPAFASIINFGADLNGVKVRARLFYEDRLEEEFDLFTVDVWRNLSKLVIPIGIENCLRHLSGKNGIQSATFWLESDGGITSAPLYISFTNDLFPAITPLMYLDSIGCFHTVYSYGKRTFGYDIDKTAEAFAVEVYENPLQHTFRELGVKIRDTVKISSGFFPISIIANFRDFMLSSFKYVLLDGKWRPVVGDVTAIEESTDFENLKAITFTLKFSKEETLYSK